MITPWMSASSVKVCVPLLYVYYFGFIYSSPSHYDECTDNNGGCNQTCNNTVGSFFCSYGDGYRLDDDMTSCNGIIIPASL